MSERDLRGIRDYYQVPAYRDVRVAVNGRPGVITGAMSAHLLVLFDGERRAKTCHPTDGVVYDRDRT